MRRGLQILPITTTSEEAREHFELGREAAFHWNVTQAHQHLDAAIAADPALVLAYLHRAGTSRPEERQPYFAQAEANLQRVTQAERHMVDAFRAFLIDLDYERAVRIFEGLCAEYPDDHHLRGYLGLRFYMNLERYDEAAEQFERALAIHPHWPQAYNFLGHVALERKDFAAALAAFERYRRLAREEPQPYCSLGDLYCSLGRHAEAAAYYEQVLQRDPDFSSSWEGRPGWMRDVLGWTYVEAGLFDEADRVLRENIRLHPTFAPNYDSLGRLYLQLGRHEGAAAQFAAALELDPELTASRENLQRASGTSAETGGPESMPERYLLPITTVSQEARLRFVLGRRAAHHYQFAEAREHLDAAIAADPAFVLALLHRGGSATNFSEVKEYLGRAKMFKEQVSGGEQMLIDAFHSFLLEDEFDRAVEILTQLSADYPDDPYLASYLGLRYYRNLRRFDEAAEQFRRALKCDPSFVQAYNWLGNIAMDRGDLATAKEMFESYVRLAPEQPRAYNSLGILCFRQGRYEEAAHRFEEALARDPRFTESRDNLLRARTAPLNDLFEVALRRQDASALAALYTAGAQLLPAGKALIEGTEAIRRFWQDAFEAGLTDAALETLEIYAGADDGTVTGVGRYRLACGDLETDVGKYVVVWLRTPEGWRFHRVIWTTDRPPSE